jgi:hypothetical protein
MKRTACLLLILGAVILATSKEGSACPLPCFDVSQWQTGRLTDVGDKREDRGDAEASQEGESRQRLRKGFGARLWGGPYWGYGPSWGRRCETCRDDCGPDNDSGFCKRCRARCGE